MNKYKIKKVFEYIIVTLLLFYTFFAVCYLIFFPNKTIEEIIFTSGSVVMAILLFILERDKSILRVELLKRLRGDLGLKIELAKAGVANKYNYEKEEELLVYVLGLLGCEKEFLETVEGVNNLLK